MATSGLSVQIIDGSKPRLDGTIKVGNDRIRLVVGQYENAGLNSTDAQSAFDIAIAELKREGTTGSGKTLPLNDYYGPWLNVGDNFPLYFFGYQNDITGWSYWVAFYLKHPDSGGSGQQTGVQYITSENGEIMDVDNQWVSAQNGQLRHVEFSLGFCEQLAQNGTEAVSTHLYIQPK
jgi:hypothetical protein